MMRSCLHLRRTVSVLDLHEDRRAVPLERCETLGRIHLIALDIDFKQGEDGKRLAERSRRLAPPGPDGSAEELSGRRSPSVPVP